jgi:hypothetical protein
MPAENTVTIGGKTISVSRLRLRGWAELENLKGQMDEAISRRDFTDYFRLQVEFIEMALSPTDIVWEEVPWYEVVMAFNEVVKTNTVSRRFPILEGNGKESKKQPWEYEGRSWYFWSNLFAKNYGWDLETIANMEVEDALGLYQELSIDDQFEKEWQYGLTEIAYPYNSSTKKSEFKPLERPKWMLPIAPKEPIKIKMRKDIMPMGNVIDLSAPKDKRGI